MSHGKYTIIGVYEESRKTLLRPSAYFSEMETDKGWGEPIYKVFVYGLVSGLFILLWSFLDIIGLTEGVFSGDVGVIGFFSTIIGAVVGTFFGALVILLVSSICDGRTHFESAFLLAAALMVLLPLNAFLGFFDGIAYLVGALLSLGVNLYGVYLLDTGLRLLLQAKKKPARTFSYILAGIMVLFLVVVLYARSEVKHVDERSEQEKEMSFNSHTRPIYPQNTGFAHLQSGCNERSDSTEVTCQTHCSGDLHQFFR